MKLQRASVTLITAQLTATAGLLDQYLLDSTAAGRYRLRTAPLAACSSVFSDHKLCLTMDGTHTHDGLHASRARGLELAS
jgi:hypothetical protein